MFVSCTVVAPIVRRNSVLIPLPGLPADLSKVCEVNTSILLELDCGVMLAVKFVVT